MGRRSQFTDDQLLDAAREAVAIYGRAATVAQVSAVSGAPTGSIYHRFASRDELMIRLWLRSIERFHEFLYKTGALFEAEADGEDPGGVLIALAAQTVRYCRDNPAEALAMTLFRHEHLMEIVPDSLHDRAEHINDGAFAMLAELGAKRFPDRADDPQLLELVYVCVIGLCYGLIRPYIMTGSPIPEWLDDVITRGCRGALSAGDL